MVKILIATPDKDSLLEFSTGLQKSDVEITWVMKCEDVLLQIENNKFDLLFVDEMLSDMKGIECLNKVVFENPFLNTAAISNLSSKDFHEETEGLGVLMQIPVKPCSEDGQKLFDYLNNIIKMTNPDLNKRTNL
ncbi:MAG: response regulator [Desulfobacterales bacterium]|nr:response regulator [Desulfobacterales bacterium]